MKGMYGIMTTRCEKCGTLLSENDRFCPNCGENISQDPTAVQPANSSANTAPPPFQQNGGQGYNAPPPYAPAPAPQYNPSPANDKKMTPKQWALTLFLTTCLGIISIVLLFVWGFGSSAPEEKRNFCKGYLIYMGIAWAVVIVLWIAVIAITVALGQSISESVVDYDSSYNLALMLSQFMAR